MCKHGKAWGRGQDRAAHLLHKSPAQGLEPIAGEAERPVTSHSQKGPGEAPRQPSGFHIGMLSIAVIPLSPNTLMTAGSYIKAACAMDRYFVKFHFFCLNDHAVYIYWASPGHEMQCEDVRVTGNTTLELSCFHAKERNGPKVNLILRQHFHRVSPVHQICATTERGVNNCP